MQTQDTTLTPNEQGQIATVDIAANQERRSALGREFGLDVGPPNETVTLANAQTVAARDKFGLLLDTRKYASRKCNSCYGRGTVTVVHPVPIAHALKLIAENPANEALLHQRSPGKYETHNATMCACARMRYRKTADAFARVLVQRGLARVAGITVGARGQREEVIELL